VSINSDEVAEGANLRAAAAEKPGITQLILAVRSPFPYGLTTREIRGLTGASAKLSKLAACGVIEKFYRHRWRVKPGERGQAGAPSPTG
jgi:hypothetical protein